MSATERKKRAEAAASPEVYRGILVRPSGNGGWLHREVAIPARLVDEYAEEKAPTPDLKPRIVDRVMRWLANPDLLRRGW